MSHESPSYANSNSHDSAMIMKILQQSKQSNEAPVSVIRHNPEMPRNSSDEYYWYYLDPRNNVQGPFHDNQMFQWWSQGIYFQNNLLMKRKGDSDFSTLQDYSKRFNGVPFNRKDIRVPPLTESLSINHSSNFIGSKLFNNGAMPTHPHLHQGSNPLTDQTMLLQMFSGPNPSPDDVAKLIQKVNLQNRVPNQIEQLHAIPSMQHNGADPYLYNDTPTSLSYVKPHSSFNNQYQQQLVSAECKSIPIDSYAKQERFPGPSWGSMQQTALMDTVWTSKSNERISTNHNAVWSQPNNDSASTESGLLSNMFQDSKLKSNAPQPDSRNCNPIQDSWDNLDPAIIKIVPSIDHSMHPASSNVHKEVVPPRQRTPPTDNPQNSRMHSENAKSAWAEMVRKSNSTNYQKYKSGCNSENEHFTNHSVSPNQNKNSLTSNSSDENEQQQSESSDKDLESLISWCKSYLENKPGLSGVDISTLVELLSSVESPYEVDAMIRENVPDFDNISDFVKVFLEKRRPLRLKIASDNQKKKPKSPPKIEENSLKWQVKSNGQGSSKKKRKNNKN